LRIAIIGLGLIGGSLGLALKKAEPRAYDITGSSRNPDTIARAIKLGAIDRAASNAAEAAKDAEAVIIATPVRTVREIMAQFAGHLRPDAIVSDVASTKSLVMQWAAKLLPAQVNFIGGHPMAGKETSGIEAADATLFQRSVYCLTPAPGTTPKALETMSILVRKAGATPYVIDAKEHDTLVAGISHLPLLLSVTLVSTTTKNKLWGRMSKLAASGYRDVTRLASGNVKVNTDICATNAEAIVYWIDEYRKELERVRQLVRSGDEALEKALAEASEARSKWLRSRP
jgi:prephenate dehydrogenase